MASCDTCTFLVYDEEDESYVCDIDMDEDDMYHMLSNQKSECPFYKSDDEYAVVRHQM